MLLAKLCEYADTLDDIAPAGYTMKRVRYEIHLDRNGQLLNPEPIDLADADAKGGQLRWMPDADLSSGIRPSLLSHNAEYTFGIPRTERTRAKQESTNRKVVERHNAYMNQLQKCVDDTQDESVRAVLHFLMNNPVVKMALPDKFDATSPIVFRVDGNLVHELPAVKSYWYEWRFGEDSDYDYGPEMPCIICGYVKQVMNTLPEKIKGIPGGKSTGMVLISAKEKAFQSYGLDRSQNSPICLECANKFTKAINALLRDEYHSYRIAGLVFIYWTRKPVGEGVFSLFRSPSPQDVERLLKAYYSGQKPAPIDAIDFYGASLSASGSRIVVRDWIDTTVGDVKAGLACWFQRQQIVDVNGDKADPLGIKELALATVNNDVKRPEDEIPATTVRTLLRAALTGSPLPDSLLYLAIRRNQAERDVTMQRAALMKLVLLSKDTTHQEEDMVQLQPDHPDASYHCGRLLAVLEQTQKSALGKINANVVDRFYGTASTAPASVFGRLLQGVQPHLSKLKGSDSPKKRAAARALEDEIEEILSRLDSFPRTLKPEMQALFALGYYHQRAHDHHQAQETIRKREAEEISIAES